MRNRSADLHDEFLQLIQRNRTRLQVWLLAIHYCLLGTKPEKRDDAIALFAKSCGRHFAKDNDKLNALLQQAIKTGLQQSKVTETEKVIKDYLVKRARIKMLPIEPIFMLFNYNLRFLEKYNYTIDSVPANSVPADEVVNDVDLDRYAKARMVDLLNPGIKHKINASLRIVNSAKNHEYYSTLLDWVVKQDARCRAEEAELRKQIKVDTDAKIFQTKLKNKTLWYLLIATLFAVFNAFILPKLLSEYYPALAIFNYTVFAINVFVSLFNIYNITRDINLTRHEEAYDERYNTHLKTLQADAQECQRILNEYLRIEVVECESENASPAAESTLSLTCFKPSPEATTPGEEPAASDKPRKVKRRTIFRDVIEDTTEKNTKTSTLLIDEMMKDKNKYYRTITKGKVVTRLELDRSVKHKMLKDQWRDYKEISLYTTKF